MSPRRSIGERMRRTSRLAVRREIARDWAATWRRDHAETLAAARAAVEAGDAAEAERRLMQMHALSCKGFDGLATVIAALSDPDADVVEASIHAAGAATRPEARDDDDR